MKLRIKIVCISSIAIILTLLLTGLLVFRVCSEVMLEEAVNAAFVEVREEKNKIESYVYGMSGAAGKSDVRSYLKTYSDDLTVCLEGFTEENVFNNTVLSIDELKSGRYVGYGGMEYKKHKAAGNDVLIFSFSTFGFDFYRIVNINHVYDNLYQLAALTLIVSAFMSVVSVLVLSVILKKTLSPLKALSEGAKGIAEGAYGKRVEIKTRDEIGALAEDFNSMAQAVERHTKELEESERRKTVFMGNLTHEMKTPLTSISGYAQLLRNVELSEEDRNEALTYIYEESKRLDRLSKKMMRLLELDNETEIVLKTEKIEELFECTLKSCKGAAQLNGVTLEAAGKGMLQCDFDLMCDVLINLTDNAIKASAPSSKVRLYTEDGTIVVEDTGCGIPKEELKKITEPFYMVDKSRSRRKGGAGLGLALVQLIVRAHNMNMTIESEVGKGTVVRILT